MPIWTPTSLGLNSDKLMQVKDYNKTGSWRVGDAIFGHTAINDRHGHALFMVAARAIARSGIPLKGDILLTSVSGETGQAPVDEYQGLKFEGKGFGSSYLVEHGARADYALIAETTSFTPCWHHTGATYYKIVIRGRNMYTPRLDRGETLADHPNAIVKAAAIVEAVERWAIEYTKKNTRETVCGEARPNAQIGAVRGGMPWRPNRSSPYCALYMDVRTLPDANVDEITASLSQALNATGIKTELSVIMSKRGAEGVGIEPLRMAIDSAHRKVRGTGVPAKAQTSDVSMWRDTNIFNNAGIPAIDFGPSRGNAKIQGTGSLELDALVDAAKMYALIALQIAAGIEIKAV